MKTKSKTLTYILDNNGNVIPEEDSLKWSKWMDFGNVGSNRIIRQTQIGGYLISTVFLGLDHGFSMSNDDNEDPVVFETMIFFDNNKDIVKKLPDEYNREAMWRYKYIQEAIFNHDGLVNCLYLMAKEQGLCFEVIEKKK